MASVDSVLKRIRYRRTIHSRDTESISNELANIQSRQRYLWNHGEDSDVPEYEDNIRRIEILSSEMRQRINRGGRVHYHINSQEGKR